VTLPAGIAASRILIVGQDSDVSVSLHLHLERAGCVLFCAATPAEIEPLMRAVGPHVIILMLPASPDGVWGNALASASAAAKVGVRVVVVAPSREIVEPLAAVAGAERAFSRTEVLARPLAAIERVGGSPPMASPPPPIPGPTLTPQTGHVIMPGLDPAQRYRVPTTGPATPIQAEVASTPAPKPASKPKVDLLAMIDEELVDEPKTRPKTSFVEVSVSLVSEHNFFVGVTKGIESGGVFIATMIPPPVGTHLHVRLGLADGRKLDVEGDVAFVREKAAMMGRQPAGCGVRLTALPPWAAEAINRFLQARQPLVYVPG
jgi:hypothetical protein